MKILYLLYTFLPIVCWINLQNLPVSHSTNFIEKKDSLKQQIAKLDLTINNTKFNVFKKTIEVNGSFHHFYPLVMEFPDNKVYDITVYRKKTDKYCSFIENGFSAFYHLKASRMEKTQGIFMPLKSSYNPYRGVWESGYTDHGKKLVIWLRGGGNIYHIKGNLSTIPNSKVMLSYTKTNTTGEATFVAPK